LQQNRQSSTTSQVQKEIWPYNNVMSIEPVIVEYFSDQNEVVAVYLFGSYANEQCRDDSDIDLAILCDFTISPEHFVRIELKYFKELSRLIRKNLDVVILNRRGELLSYEVFRNGKVIFEGDRETRVAFQARRVCDYLDFAPLMQQMSQGMMKKLEERLVDG
jgi:predicted nucleotidyltransferase